MAGKTILVWFRNDLRLHDNELLTEAIGKSAHVLPVYCFDPFYFRTLSSGIQKTGFFRARFLLESVADLRENLRKAGSDLLIAWGKPEEIIPQLAAKYQVNEVYHHREVASEETRISARVEEALWKMRINLKHFIGHTMYHKEDLPFPIKDIPDVFTTFRKKVERDTSVRPSLPAPEHIPSPEITEPGDIPSLSDLGISEEHTDERAVLCFKGGETEGLKRLNAYLWNGDHLREYKQTRNGLLGADYSTKLSPWLSLGCVSPRFVYDEVKRYERERVANDSTYWLIFELLWRDYFRFMFKKHGNQFFQPAGFHGSAPDTDAHQDERFDAWKNARTGIPFIDANMRELNTTGYMSNRGRQNVASYLVKDLKVSWIRGAAWFEEKLIDYNPASNWGNWAYVAGVGNDPRENRYFNIIKQAREYDPKGAYVKHWLPELAELPVQFVHEPYLLPEEEQLKYGFKPGEQYPLPVASFRDSGIGV
ncbi:MAG: DASH family cryptochrome [Mucilaginibacter polytrichastri]|nr:DASH family cryptochrome [Mucilaginibacter polytrichastri]